MPYPLGVSPSQRFRFEQYFDVLKNAKIDFEVLPFWSVQAWNILYQKGNHLKKFVMLLGGLFRRFKMLFHLRSFDFVFIHREAAPIGPPFFEWWIANISKKKIIYDFDDAIWLANTSEENKLASFIKWHGKTKSICKWSHKISCGNEFLMDFAKLYNPIVVLNPTTIDTENLHRSFVQTETKNKLTIGWTGTHSTLKYLDSLVDTLKKISKENPDIEVNVISNKPPTFNFPSLHFTPWSKENEIPDLLKFDIGIMPLMDDLWACGKCGFKALQYMALGIPVIASPVGVNSKIIDNGVDGFLCDSEQEWLKAFEKLIHDHMLRLEMGRRGRKKVVERYSVTSNSANFLSLFSFSQMSNNANK